MADPTTSTAQDSVSGKMFLYEQPELLTVEKHRSLGLTPLDRPFRHAASVRIVPLTMTEFSSAQRHYPIVFSSMENPIPLAAVGVLDDVNLFVDDGQWDPMCYVPSYLRCHPFAFASSHEGRVAVVIDRAAASISDKPQYPFFADGELTTETEQMMRFCAQYEAERKRTEALTNKLQELELLTSQQATFKPDGQSEEQALASFISIDTRKLTELGADVVHELHRSGQLSAMYLQLYSLDNWRMLMARRQRRAAASADSQ